MSVFLTKKLVRVLDTRIFHGFESNIMIRNFTVKENSIEDLLRKNIIPTVNNCRLDEAVCQNTDPIFSVVDQIML